MYKYTIKWWDTTEKNTQTDVGIVHGATYHEAMEHLETYFDVESIISIRLEELDHVLEVYDLKEMFKGEIEND